MANNREEFIAYATHLRAEHRRLQACLQRIDGQWGDREISWSFEFVRNVTQKLEALRAELAHHFEEEEAGGCLDEAVARQPSLGHEEHRLRQEHPDLLEQLDRVIVRIKAVSQSIQSLDEAKEEFQRFSEHLRAHESAENRMLEKGFGIEVE